MRSLEERIAREGKALPGGIVKAGSFLNHMIDTSLAADIAREFARRFAGSGVTKILTIESSGIAFAVLTGVQLCVPVVFAKKTMGNNTAGEAWTAPVRSYTKRTESSIYVSKPFLCPSDCILIIDDFLAYGEAAFGLAQMVRESGAKLCGVGVVIEKAYEPGGEKLRAAGIRVESLARISSVENGVIQFENQTEEEHT